MSTRSPGFFIRDAPVRLPGPSTSAAGCADFAHYRCTRAYLEELSAVYAIVATVRVADPELARAALSTDRIPVVPRAPGFVAAYWLEPVDGIGMSIIVFDSREHADVALQYSLPKLPGVTPIEARVREVYASIQG